VYNCSHMKCVEDWSVSKISFLGNETVALVLEASNPFYNKSFLSLEFNPWIPKNVYGKCVSNVFGPRDIYTYVGQ
jgi:hypothetical protein